MNIDYYKQQSNDFILFAKRPSRHRRKLLISVLIVSLMTSLGYLKFKRHYLSAARQPIVALTDNNPMSAQLAENLKTQTSELLQNSVSEKLANTDPNKNLAANSPTLNQKNSAPLSTLAGKTYLVTIKSRDTLGRIFSRYSISQKEMDTIIKTNSDTKTLKKLHPGKQLTLVLDQNHQIQQLNYPIDLTDTLIITRKSNNKFISHIQSRELETRQAVAKFTIFNSLTTAGKKAGLSSSRIAQLATIFKSNLDVNKAKQSGNKVFVLYQDYYLDGKQVREGDIIAAEYITPTNTYQAVRFTDPKGNSGFYAPDGSSMQKRFLPSPVKFTRISSLFSANRWHPILHRFRHHNGVDYAAPYGTPIKSVGNGTIALMGRKGGYGNTIIIKHDSSYSTLYGHLSKYAKDLHSGSHVTQGQVIGYVGSSGLATGPHLHFEFRINGVRRNPLTVALPNGKSITQAYRNKFHAVVKKLIAKLELQQSRSS